MKKEHDIRSIRFEKDALLLTIDGVARSFELKKVSTALLNASGEERSAYEISPSGYGIHWPLIDEDLSIDGLLCVVHYPKHKTKAV